LTIAVDVQLLYHARPDRAGGPFPARRLSGRKGAIVRCAALNVRLVPFATHGLPVCSQPTHAIGRTSASLAGTLGGEGVEWADGGQRYHRPAPRTQVRDTTAAGDCFVGVLAAALDRGATLAEAVTRAVTAASLSCTRVGSQNSLPDARETDAALLRLAAF
jgi:hypothetical protein